MYGKSIVANKGSVQHLDILTPEEKEVFKTAVEINQSMGSRTRCRKTTVYLSISKCKFILSA